MHRLLGRAFYILTLLPLGVSANAVSQEADFLSPQDVLSSAERHFPLILQSLAARRGASGTALEAEGAFDLVFSAEGSRAAGYYDNTALQGGATQRLRNYGASVYADYAISNGRFPIYQDRNFTNTGGTARVGMLFSLLRDRSIDQQRFGLRDAQPQSTSG